MLLSRNENNIGEKLKQAYIEELREYCKEQGFTAEQTETFIENSLKSEDDYLGE